MDPAEISCKMQREGANTPHVGAEQEIVAVQWCEVWELRLKKKIKIHDLFKVLLPVDGLASLSACCQINLHIDRLDLKVCAFLGKGSSRSVRSRRLFLP